MIDCSGEVDGQAGRGTTSPSTRWQSGLLPALSSAVKAFLLHSPALIQVLITKVSENGGTLHASQPHETLFSRGLAPWCTRSSWVLRAWCLSPATPSDHSYAAIQLLISGIKKNHRETYSNIINKSLIFLLSSMALTRLSISFKLPFPPPQQPSRRYTTTWVLHHTRSRK